VLRYGLLQLLHCKLRCRGANGCKWRQLSLHEHRRIRAEGGGLQGQLCLQLLLGYRCLPCPYRLRQRRQRCLLAR
jgi:hypothetical protein